MAHKAHYDALSETETGTWDLVSLVEEKRGKISAQKEEQREREKQRLSEIQKTGFLSKRVNMVQGWQRRYFILENGIFQYGRREDTNKWIPIPLANAVLLKCRGKSARFIIDSGTLVVHLRAKNQQERTSWLSALTEVKSLLNKLTQKPDEEDPFLTSSTSAEPLFKMKDCMSRVQKLKHTIVTHLGPNFDGIVAEAKTNVKRDLIKDLGPNLAELFRTVTSLEEEVDIVVSSLMEQIEVLKGAKGAAEKQTSSGYEGSEIDSKSEEMSEEDESSNEFFDAEEQWPAPGEKRDESEEEDSDSDADFFRDLSPSELRKSIDTDRPSQTSSVDDDRTGKLTKGKSLVDSLVQVAQLSHNPASSSQSSSINASLATIPANFKCRDRLPSNKDFTAKVPLSKILKDAIGKDMTRITIPVVFSEPLSLLQRLGEEHEYADLLNTAVGKEDSCLRLAYVASFAVSSYSSTPGRMTKPFNPLLGETFEYQNRKKEFRIIAEQVCHHPPVSAAFAEGHGWSMWGHAYVKLKFWGKSMEIFPDGYITAEIAKFKDKFVWNKVTTVVQNVLVGTKYIDHYGDMVVINQSTGDKCKINFEKTGWFNSANGRVVGIVYNSKNVPRYKIEGSWMNSLKCTAYVDGELDVGTQFVIWEKDPMPEWAKDQFNFTFFAMECNELPEFLKPLLPQTDSRWRPDQRAFENGNVDLAQSEKERLEDRQRARAKIHSEDDWEPRWFTKEDYTYKGGYWEQRLAGKFTDVPDIFEIDMPKPSIPKLPSTDSFGDISNDVPGSKPRKKFAPVAETTNSTSSSPASKAKNKTTNGDEDTESEQTERSTRTSRPRSTSDSKKDRKEKEKEKKANRRSAMVHSPTTTEESLHKSSKNSHVAKTTGDKSEKSATQ